jgi:hypothetical protein
VKNTPCLDAQDVEASASTFRERYAPNHIGPIEIERILEFKMHVEIVPVRHLCKHHQCKGYVCANGRRICVDRDILRSQSEEYRTLLAHETAHIYYHPSLIPPAYNSLADCRRFLSNLSKEVRYSMEWEAREWSGRILIPAAELRGVFDSLVSEYHQRYIDVYGVENGHGIFGGLIADMVANRFGVLQPIADARIRREGLWAELGRLTKRAGKKSVEEQVS